MPRVDLVVETAVSSSVRARQVCSMFDVPPAEKCKLEWNLDLPIEAEPWNVGLVVGPSGSGKSTVMKHVWGEPVTFEWSAPSLIDDFEGSGVQAVAEVCQAVGFNTIPAWLRPHAVLSNGEKFRAELARHMLSDGDPIVVDEFSSVVDRQVAQIASHAVQKYIRRHERRFVAVTCHYDVIDWLQPDWVLDMATREFTRRSLQRRPAIECVVQRVPYETWRLFAPFHYLTASLHRNAKCFALFARGQIAVFAGTLHRPHPKVDDIIGVSRVVTLPDWQGLGLAMVLLDDLGAAYKAIGKRLHMYPSHPSFVRTFDRSRAWKIVQKPGLVQGSNASPTSRVRDQGKHPCAVFAYVGSAMEVAEARALLN